MKQNTKQRRPHAEIKSQSL